MPGHCDNGEGSATLAHNPRLLMFRFGDSYFGKVDWVPGLFYVRTRFLHIWFFPFVPRQSYLFFDEPPGGSYLGVRIPLRWTTMKERRFAWPWTINVKITLRELMTELGIRGREHGG
jgi:hypothetical protein